MKATETKYLLLLHRLQTNPAVTQAELADALDVPPSLVNRYLKRLAQWRALRITGRTKKKYTLTDKGATLLQQASWAFLAFNAGLLARLERDAVEGLRTAARALGARNVMLYGQTPLARFVRTWARAAELEVVGLCDEERPGSGVLKLDDLAQSRFDCFVLTDWAKAEDKLLASLLAHYAPVINLFLTDGAAAPKWR